MRYICNTFEVPDNLYPKDPKVKGRVDSYLDWHHNGVRRLGMLLFSTTFAKRLGVKMLMETDVIRKEVI